MEERVIRTLKHQYVNRYRFEVIQQQAKMGQQQPAGSPGPKHEDLNLGYKKSSN